MSSTVVLGIALALVASCALNGGYFLQHRGAHDVPPVDARRPIATLRALLASPVWLLGTAAGLMGWGLYITALSRAPLSLVQAFSAGGLALVVPVAARLTGTRLRRPELAAVVLMAAALATLSIGTAARHRLADPVALSTFLLACGGVAAAVALRAKRHRAGGLGLGAGVLYGAGDTATKAAIAAGHGSLLAMLLSPWVAAVLAVSAGAFFCFQRGLQIGDAVSVIALMTAGTNVAAIVGGVMIFGESLGAQVPLVVLHAVALVAVVPAAWRLAGAQTRIADRGDVGERRRTTRPLGALAADH